MAFCTLPFFGPLDAEALDEYYHEKTEFDGHEIGIDLNFENKTIDGDRMETVKHFIDNIRIYDFNNKGYIENDYKDNNGNTVKPYLLHHLEELGESELNSLIDSRNKSIEPEEQLLKKLHLVRVGIYPDGEDQFAIFDYSLGTEITNYLVVIKTDENGNLDFMTMES